MRVKSQSAWALTVLCLFAVLLVFAACEGEMGPQGLQGVQGAEGPEGPEGPQGPPGPSAATECFVCHSDTDTKLVSAEGQYDFSIHASANNVDRSSGSCSGCHVSEGFVARAAGGSPGSYSNPTAIHCFTCHAPHTNSDFRLRATTPLPLQDGTVFDLGAANICVWCHQARRDVNTYVITSNDTTNVSSTHWGPHHGVQGDMLIGSNGYEYALPDPYPQTNHRGITANGCKDCHFDVTSNYRVGGHSFNMVWDEGGPEEMLNTDACEQCHAPTSDFDINNVQTDTDALMAQLQGLLITANLLDTSDHPVPRIVAANDSAGALWNYLMAEEDRSHGVHNKNYIQDLLRSAIIFMGDTPAASPMAARWEPEHVQGGSR
jgi:hypothetical protein